MGSRVIFEIHDLPQGFLGPQVMRWFLTGRGAYRLVVITHALVIDLQDQFSVLVNSPLTMIAPDGVDLERYTDLPTPQPARLALASATSALTPERFTAGYTGICMPGAAWSCSWRLPPAYQV